MTTLGLFVLILGAASPAGAVGADASASIGASPIFTPFESFATPVRNGSQALEIAIAKGALNEIPADSPWRKATAEDFVPLFNHAYREDPQAAQTLVESAGAVALNDKDRIQDPAGLWQQVQKMAGAAGGDVAGEARHVVDAVVRRSRGESVSSHDEIDQRLGEVDAVKSELERLTFYGGEVQALEKEASQKVANLKAARIELEVAESRFASFAGIEKEFLHGVLPKRREGPLDVDIDAHDVVSRKRLQASLTADAAAHGVNPRVVSIGRFSSNSMVRFASLDEAKKALPLFNVTQWGTRYRDSPVTLLVGDEVVDAMRLNSTPAATAAPAATLRLSARDAGIVKGLRAAAKILAVDTKGTLLESEHAAVDHNGRPSNQRDEYGWEYWSHDYYARASIGDALSVSLTRLARQVEDKAVSSRLREIARDLRSPPLERGTRVWYGSLVEQQDERFLQASRRLDALIASAPGANDPAGRRGLIDGLSAALEGLQADTGNIFSQQLVKWRRSFAISRSAGNSAAAALLEIAASESDRELSADLKGLAADLLRVAPQHDAPGDYGEYWRMTIHQQAVFRRVAERLRELRS